MAQHRHQKSHAKDLEELVASHAEIARLALAVLGDGALSPAQRAPVVAAARYGYEDLDLIQDDVPAYGLIDDLFVLGIGLDAFLTLAGPSGQRYGQAAVDGAPLTNLLQRMKNRFYGFWEYCRQNTEAFFAEVCEQAANDPAAVEQAQRRFAEEIVSIAASTAGVTLLEAHVSQFLAQYRAFNPADLADLA